MATHKSSEKRARQAKRKQSVNNRRKNTVKTHEKTLVKALMGGDKKALQSLLENYMSQVMKAAKTGLIKAETASRKISRLSTRVSAALK